MSGAGRSKVKVSGLVSSEASLLGMETHPVSLVPAQKDTSPAGSGPMPQWPHLNLIDFGLPWWLR